MGWGALRRGKFNAQPIDIGGEHFDSTGEGRYTLTLESMKAAGRYSTVIDGRFVNGPFAAWRRGDRHTLVAKPPGGPKDGFARRAITLKPDYFVYPSPDGAPMAALDYKGMRTGIFNMKAILWLTVYPDCPLYIVGKDGEWKRA